ncbi:flagellar basal body-associated FliL family protein [Aerolutibacter ruishenii]|uniref:Flagellar protein FliL n=1 Tax=Aerolutibacter ruishenii TaxID=686800 RepID=A0A562LK98_9GAMM|nr:flagellar basal body-associated FliL family protein [Lysobacter ruishenii]TWI08021.1 flagellar FliL protein [Lysobacter ruishenii]
MADPTANAAPAPAPAKPRRRPRRTVVWILLALLLAGAAAGGYVWWQQAQAVAAISNGKGKGKGKVVNKAPALYHALEPAFVVNLSDEDAVRYMQADVQIMTRDPATLAAIQQHTPALRNRLLLLFSQQSAVQLRQRSAKERLQEQALEETRQLLRLEQAAAKVDAVFFTSLVTQ